MSDIIKDSMIRLSFDVTRKCNMNCKWCCKGDAQNENITKEIIDKTIDEMQDVYIAQIRFFGGEPLLNPDMIEYIIDKLIEKHILFDTINIFSNATIRSQKIVDSFNKALKYFAEIEDEIIYTKNALKKIIKFGIDNFIESERNKLRDKKISMLLSAGDICNSNKNEIDATLDFYNSKIGDGFIATDIYTDNKHPKPLVINFEGKACNNYFNLIDVSKPFDLTNARKIVNQYCILKRWIDEPEKRFIKKALSVATNGNVYVGCSLPYERIDKEAMFKIQDCNKDFFDKVEDWCFNHNIHDKGNRIREKYELARFCREKGICIKDMTENDFQVLQLYNSIILAQEKLARDEHILCPHLSTDEVECMAIATICLKLMEDGNASYETIQKYLHYCTDFGAENILNVNPKYLRGLILWLSDKNNERELKDKHSK